MKNHTSPSHRSLARRKRRQAGFTLIEMLVVIAIIALLAALMIPSLNKARASAQRTACASNMKNCGTALLAYATEHGGTIPESHTGAGYTDSYSSSFIEQMESYVGDFKVWGCPAAGVVPLTDPRNTSTHVRANYHYFPGIVATTKLTTIHPQAPILQDITYTYNGDWRSNHTEGGRLRTDAVPNSPSFRTYFGGTPEGFNLLSADMGVKWAKWNPALDGLAWMHESYGSKVLSTKTAFEALRPK